MQFQKGLLMFFFDSHMFFFNYLNFWSTGATTNPRLFQAQMPLDGEMEYLCTSISPWKMWPFSVTFFVGKKALEHI